MFLPFHLYLLGDGEGEDGGNDRRDLEVKKKRRPMQRITVNNWNDLNTASIFLIYSLKHIYNECFYYWFCLDMLDYWEAGKGRCR